MSLKKKIPIFQFFSNSLPYSNQLYYVKSSCLKYISSGNFNVFILRNVDLQNNKWLILHRYIYFNYYSVSVNLKNPKNVLLFYDLY